VFSPTIKNIRETPFFQGKIYGKNDDLAKRRDSRPAPVPLGAGYRARAGGDLGLTEFCETTKFFLKKICGAI
jgi:hypothetical protein